MWMRPSIWTASVWMKSEHVAVGVVTRCGSQRKTDVTSGTSPTGYSRFTARPLPERDLDTINNLTDLIKGTFYVSIESFP